MSKRFNIILEAAPDPLDRPADVRLASLLKIARRRFGLCAVDVAGPPVAEACVNCRRPIPSREPDEAVFVFENGKPVGEVCPACLAAHPEKLRRESAR